MHAPVVDEEPVVDPQPHPVVAPEGEGVCSLRRREDLPRPPDGEIVSGGVLGEAARIEVDPVVDAAEEEFREIRPLVILADKALPFAVDASRNVEDEVEGDEEKQRGDQ